MHNGSIKDYRFGSKNNWRRWMWNEVLRRTDGRERSERILYLAGNGDLDRPIALSKGVPDHNLVAIDRYKPNIERLREQGKFSIHATAFDVLFSWPESQPVCAVLMDLCCGLTVDALDLYDVLERPVFRNAVGMMNLMRGRDKTATQIMTMFQQWGHGGSLWRCKLDGSEEAEQIVERNHRGFLLLLYHLIDTWSCIHGAGTCYAKIGSGKHRLIAPPPVDHPAYPLFVRFMTSWFTTQHNPVFNSYRSGPLVFDSVVFEHPMRLYAAHRHEIDAVATCLPKAGNTVEDFERAYRRPWLTRQIIALAAVATRRLRSRTSSKPIL